MKRIETENIVCFDVDDTLIAWNLDPDKETIEINGYMMNPIHEHITGIKQHKGRGHFIIVWSQGGVDWAEEVVKALGMEDVVDIVMTKPKWYYDDIPANDWMKRIFHLEQ